MQVSRAIRKDAPRQPCIQWRRNSRPNKSVRLRAHMRPHKSKPTLVAVAT
jgi:hypothetical protein